MIQQLETGVKFMKLTKCSQSHFYDADKYDDCPHCSAKAGAVRQAETKAQTAVRTTTQSAVSPTESQQTGVNGMTVSFKQAVNRTGFDSPQEISAPNPTTEEAADHQSKVESVDDALHAFARLGSAIFRKHPEEKVSSHDDMEIPQQRESAEKVVVSQVQSASVKTTQQAVALSNPAASPPEQKPLPQPALPAQTPVASPVQETKTMQQTNISQLTPPQNGGELAQAVAAAKAKPTTDDGRTVAYYQFADAEPVVGWLIGLSGFYFGESFNLKAGHNFIGRSLSMDVALVEEKSVSREYHANIIFDPKSRRFFIQAGRGNGLTYLNDELLLSPAELHIYNKIQLGDHSYIFMPFCGKNFSWDDYVNED